MNNILEITGTINKNLDITRSYLDTNMNKGILFEGDHITFSEDITHWKSDWIISVNNNQNNPITINGNNHSIHVESGFVGLIRMNDGCCFIVESINIVAENNNIGDGNGSILTLFVGGFVNFTILNCTSNTTSNGDYSGGIVGRLECLEESEGKISGCITTGNISGTYAGGIVGRSNINLIINNCSSSGKIMGPYASGIIAEHTNATELYIYGSYSSGDITRKNNAGILGTCKNNMKVYINACYSMGNIRGENSGGIVGGNIGEQSNAGYFNVANCYSKGEILGYRSGGIMGGSVSGDCKIRIYNCFTQGEISGLEAGGIIGGMIRNSNLIIMNCFTKGEISGTGSGGILGAYAGQGNSGYNIVYNCYTVGNISGDHAGGLCGTDHASSLHTIAFYAAGINIGAATGGLSGRSENSQLGLTELVYTRQSTQTDTEPFLLNSHFDGSNDMELIMSTLPDEHGFEHAEPYPYLKSFTHTPWKRYGHYKDTPKLNPSNIKLDLEDLDLLKIHDAYYIIDIVLGQIAVFNMMQTKNEFHWSIDVISHNLAHKWHQMTWSDLAPEQQTSIISSLDGLYGQSNWKCRFNTMEMFFPGKYYTDDISHE